MPYSFRNRNEIRAPSRLDDPEHEYRKAIYREPDIDEEVYRSSPPQSYYRGPLTQFNPDLPPAAFPTLDDPKLASHQRPQPFDDNFSSAELSITRNQQIGGNVHNGRNGRTSQFPEENAPLTIDEKLTLPRARTPTSRDFVRMRSTSNHSSRPTTCKYPACFRGLRPQHNGTAESILEDNQRRMYAAGKLTSFDRNMLEMMSSDEEDEADAREQPEQEVFWDNLTTGLKLQLYDVVFDAYSSGHATQRLQLKDVQAEELSELIFTRNQVLLKEEEDGARHRHEVHERLLRGARISEGKFREMLDVNLFQHVQEDGHDHDYYDHGYLSQAADVEKARLYLTQCRLNPKLLDGAWTSVPRATTITLDRANNDSTTISGSSQYCDSPLQHPRGMVPGQIAPRSTPTGLHSTKSRACDALDDSRSPSRYPLLHTGQSTPLSVQRSPQVQRDRSLDRQSSGFIRPSIGLGKSAVAGPRLPPKGEFVHRPELVRIELIRVRKAAIEANRAGLDRQVNEARAKDKVMGKKPTPSTHQDRGVKRHATTDVETSFLNNERRPGARRPKLTEKVVDAEMATGRKKKRISDGSTPNATPSEETVHPKTAGRYTDGLGKGTSQMILQKPTKPDVNAAGHATAEPTSYAMMRKDSAIDLTADDDDDEDELA